jgi:hypothetical protein
MGKPVRELIKLSIGYLFPEEEESGMVRKLRRSAGQDLSQGDIGILQVCGNSRFIETKPWMPGI